MDNVIKKIKNNSRHIFQFVFTCLSNGYLSGFLKGNIYKGKGKFFCLPGLNCYSCPGALGSCPVGSFQAVIGDRNYKFAFYVSGILIFFGALFGRFICGFLCPFGLVQDLIYKNPFFKKLKKLPGEKFLKYIKYIILILFVILLPLFAVDFMGTGKPWFCQYICPSGTLFGGIPLISSSPALRGALGWLFTWKTAILVVLIFLSLIVYRPFCRYLCPLGAFYSLFNKIALVRYKVDEDKCTKCGLCQKKCNIDIKVFETPNNAECIRCAECMKACPHKAIVFENTFEKIKNSNDKRSTPDVKKVR